MKYKLIRRILSTVLLSVILLTACDDDPVLLPWLSTLKTVDSDITSTSALVKGEITYLGNQKILEYGIEISKSPIFTPSTTKSYTTPAVTGIYQVEFTGLEVSTKYYFKAYVLINTAQVYSQNVENFTTKPAAR
jgi:hypothetical protein